MKALINERYQPGDKNNGVVALANHLHCTTTAVSAYIKEQGHEVKRGGKGNIAAAVAARQAKAALRAAKTTTFPKTKRVVNERKDIPQIPEAQLLDIAKQHLLKCAPIGKFAQELDIPLPELSKQLVGIGLTPRRGNPNYWKPLPFNLAT
jgi:hypothetical protein